MAGRRQTISKPYISLLMAIGLFTFFVPIVTTDVPVHGRSDWAAVDFLRARADRWLPAPGPFHVHAVLYVIGALYLLMILTLLLLALPSPRKPLMLVATVGAALSVGCMRWAYQDFSWLLYGRFSYAWISNGPGGFARSLVGWEGFRYDGALAVLVLIMPALVLATRTRGDADAGIPSAEYATPPAAPSPDPPASP